MALPLIRVVAVSASAAVAIWRLWRDDRSTSAAAQRDARQD